jgi:hypothetical protein
MNYELAVSKTTDEVVGTWAGDSGKPSNTSGVKYVDVTLSDYAQVNTTGLTFPSGQYCWKYTDSVLIAQVDTRQKLKFTPNSVLAALKSGGGKITVNIQTVDSSGVPVTTYTGTLYFSFNQDILQIIITNGVGSFQINKDTPRNLVIKSNASFDVFAPLTIKVYQVEL